MNCLGSGPHCGTFGSWNDFYEHLRTEHKDSHTYEGKRTYGFECPQGCSTFFTRINTTKRITDPAVQREVARFQKHFSDHLSAGPAPAGPMASAGVDRPVPAGLVCPKHNLRFDDFAAFEEHVKEHHVSDQGPRYVLCPFCDQNIFVQRRNAFSNHYQQRHRPEPEPEQKGSEPDGWANRLRPPNELKERGPEPDGDDPDDEEENPDNEEEGLDASPDGQDMAWFNTVQLTRAAPEFLKQIDTWPSFPLETIFGLAGAPLNTFANPNRAKDTRAARRLVLDANLRLDDFATPQQLLDKLRPLVVRVLTDFVGLNTLAKRLHVLKFVAYNIMIGHVHFCPIESVMLVHNIARKLTQKAAYEQQSRVALVILDPQPTLRRLQEITDALQDYWNNHFEENDGDIDLLDLACWIQMALTFTVMPLHPRAYAEFLLPVQNRDTLVSPSFVSLWLSGRHFHILWSPEYVGLTQAGRQPILDPGTSHRPEAQRVSLKLGRTLTRALRYYLDNTPRPPKQTVFSMERSVSYIRTFIRDKLKLNFDPVSRNFHYESQLMALARRAVLLTNPDTGLVDLAEIKRFAVLLRLGFAESNHHYRTWAQWQENAQVFQDFSRVFRLNFPPSDYRPTVPFQL